MKAAARHWPQLGRSAPLCSAHNVNMAPAMTPRTDTINSGGNPFIADATAAGPEPKLRYVASKAVGIRQSSLFNIIAGW